MAFLSHGGIPEPWWHSRAMVAFLSHGGIPEPWWQVRAACDGPVPPPLARWVVLPRPGGGFVLGVRGQQAAVSKRATPRRHPTSPTPACARFHFSLDLYLHFDFKLGFSLVAHRGNERHHSRLSASHAAGCCSSTESALLRGHSFDSFEVVAFQKACVEAQQEAGTDMAIAVAAAGRAAGRNGHVALQQLKARHWPPMDPHADARS